MDNSKPLLVHNAGLVLLNVFYQRLFERLGLLKDDDFISDNERHKAALYLQYLATGQEASDEFHMLLNKILCGIPVDQPIERSLNINDNEKDMIEDLIQAAINNWPAICGSSIDGFRGNWLIREGTLTEEEDQWTLVVEKRAYDILIDRIPWSYSIIKYRWMSKPLYVTGDRI